MTGLFNSTNFKVNRDNSSIYLSKKADIPCTRIDYGKIIYSSIGKIRDYMNTIYSSFGNPSFVISDTLDGPVDCWVISSCRKHEIIYIEHWKNSCPERIYIFMNVINHITSSFIKYIYESVT